MMQSTGAIIDLGEFYVTNCQVFPSTHTDKMQKRNRGSYWETGGFLPLPTRSARSGLGLPWEEEEGEKICCSTKLCRCTLFPDKSEGYAIYLTSFYLFLPSPQKEFSLGLLSAVF